MTSASVHPIEQLKTGLLELVESCPARHCNPKDCPLFDLRKMPRSRRIQWFNTLNQDDLEYLAAYHYVCMNIQIRSRRSRARPTPSTQ